MMDKTKVMPIRGALTPLSLAFVMALAGCQSASTKDSQVSDAKACSMLKNVIAQAGNDFKSLKGTATVDYDHTRWDAAPIMPGTDCDILGWGSGRTNFACTWDKANEATARSDYAGGVSLVKNCLGAEWQTSKPAGQTGEATRFARAGSPTVVELRTYQEKAPASGWQTSLTVGPPINRDAR